MHRYAVYFAPERRSRLWQAGCAWLGRDPERDADLPRPEIAGLAPEALDALTAAPRRYGFHATLKPPFRLAAGAAPEQLVAATADLASRLAPFAAPPLILSDLDGFLALTLGDASPPLHALADAVVRALDPLRAPPTPHELERRRRGGLSPAAERRLAEWGYPHVMEGFRFHLTLTRRLTPPEHGILQPVLARRFAPCLGRPLPVTELALYGEPEPDAAFRLVHRFRLGEPAKSGLTSSGRTA